MSESTISITPSQRRGVVGAALLALFLGALDALVMSAAMPSVVADLGAMDLYSWVYSAYFLSRAVSLPIIGKLADLLPRRRLAMIAIGLFILSSVGAGFAQSMTVLIVFRLLQGIGAGGIFALTYIILADVPDARDRAKSLALASSIWGIASVLGPTLGGFIVTYFSWRWIFWINAPIGLISMWGIGAWLVETRPKKADVTLDLPGAAILTTAILSFLFAFMLGGRGGAWGSPWIVSLLAVAVVGTAVFIRVERRATDPILPIGLFRERGFAAGNAAVFMSSMAIFSLFAFAPLFVQGVQGRSPMRVGLGMLSLSLGWSLGSMALGQVVNRAGPRRCAVAGAGALITGAAMTLRFTATSTDVYSFVAFFIVGVGMGFVALSTLLTVQSSVPPRDLGVATSSNQFARTLGATVGVGVCGSFIAGRFSALSDMAGRRGALEGAGARLPESGFGRLEDLLDPRIQAAMPPELRELVHEAVGQGVHQVFLAVLAASLLCLICCLLLPKDKRGKREYHR